MPARAASSMAAASAFTTGRVSVLEENFTIS